MHPLIEISDADRTLPDGNTVLTSIALSAERGESISIVGASGSGKSTLLACMGLIAPFDEGSSFRIDGRETTAMRSREADRVRGQEIGFVLQNSGLIEHLSAQENVMAPFMHRRDVPLSEARSRAKSVLKLMGLEGFERRRPLALSGGERQRVAIARAIVSEPVLILADEPTGALDVHTGKTIVDALLGLVREMRSCLVLVTHDPEIAVSTDRQFRLEAGALQAIGT